MDIFLDDNSTIDLMDIDNMTMDIDNMTRCINFSQPVFIAVGAIRATTGSISTLASVFVISLILLFKKYEVFAQRLIMYLSITVMLNGLSRATQVINYPYYPDDKNTKNFCIFIGFFDQLTVWMYHVASVVIMFYIYTKTVHLKDLKWEKFYLVITFIVPFFFAWIPFVGGTYGQAGPWCWIRRTNDDCTERELGIIYRYALFYGPSYFILIAILGMIIIMRIVIYKKKDKLILNVNPDEIKQYNMLVKETRELVWYPVILIIVQLPAVVNRITEELQDNIIYPLWFIHAIIFPLQGAFICIAYALDPDTRQAIRKCSPRALMMNACMKKDSTEAKEYPVSIGHSDSLAYRFRAMMMPTNREEDKQTP